MTLRLSILGGAMAGLPVNSVLLYSVYQYYSNVGTFLDGPETEKSSLWAGWGSSFYNIWNFNKNSFL